MSEDVNKESEPQGTRLVEIPKPEAGLYKDTRKLFLVPILLLGPDAPEGGQQRLERYFSEVRDHIQKLERSLGTVTHVYHEMVFAEGDEGLKIVEGLNPKGYSFIQAMCQSTARLEATEDRAAVEESADWHRCISIGLVSERVQTTAIEGLQETSKRRYGHIAKRIDETLGEKDVGMLFVREDHRITFPAGIQVFYVAPPALDALKRWITEQVSYPSEAGRAAKTDEEAESQPAS